MITETVDLNVGDLESFRHYLDEAMVKVILMTDRKAGDLELSACEALRLIATVRLALDVAIPVKESEATP